MKKSFVKIPIRYIPNQLSKKDKQTQKKMLAKSKRLYNNKSNKQYFTRKKLASFHSKPSNHVQNARKIYKIENLKLNQELSKKTGCSLNTLRQIVKKGEGAYYSSGSRPNQTPQSWGYARLASSITAGKAAAVDYNILAKGCKPSSKALRLANLSRKKYKYGHSQTKKKILLNHSKG